MPQLKLKQDFEQFSRRTAALASHAISMGFQVRTNGHCFNCAMFYTFLTIIMLLHMYEYVLECGIHSIDHVCKRKPQSFLKNFAIDHFCTT